jgi:hypothetical protein
MSEKVESSLTPSEVLVIKAKKPRYSSRATHIEGLSLRAEVRKVPKLTRKNIGRLASTGRRMARIDTKIRKLEADRAPLEESAIEMAKAHDGLSGIESKTDKYRLSIFAKYGVTDYDIDMLKDDLGAAYPTVIGEGLTTTVSVPFGLATSAGPVSSGMIEGAITDGLVGLGLSEEQIRQFVKTKPFIEVKEAKLGQLIIDEQVTLSPNVAKTTEEYNATTAPFNVETSA